MPTTTLVRKTADLLGRELGDAQAEKLGAVSHYLFGAAGGPAAQLLAGSRRSPLRAGLGVGTAMEAIVRPGHEHRLGTDGAAAGVALASLQPDGTTLVAQIASKGVQ